MRIGIVGAGAIGCLFGALLSSAGNDVTLVGRNPRVVSVIRQKGVRVREGTKSLTASVTAERSPADLSQVELVILAVKSYDTEEAAKIHRNRIGSGAPVLTVQNGLDNVEVLRKFLRRELVLGGATTEASLSVGPGKVIRTGRGRTWIGEPDNSLHQQCAAIAREFRKSGIRTGVTRNIRGVMWSKAIVNAAINPLSALTGMRNGLLAEFPEIREAMLGVVREGTAVSRAEHIVLDPPDPGQLLFSVLRATAMNKSSMLQDVERERKTEIRQLNGALVKHGLKHKVSTPLNQLLTALVITLERVNFQTRAGFRG